MSQKRTTLLIPAHLWAKLVLIKKDLGYSTTTHLILEAIREFIDSKGY